MTPMFAKRHYVAIAEALHSAKPVGRSASWEISWEHTVDKIAEVFERDNPNFQRERFLTACNEGIDAKYIRAGVRGGPAMPYRSTDDWRWHS